MRARIVCVCVCVCVNFFRHTFYYSTCSGEESLRCYIIVRNKVDRIFVIYVFAAFWIQLFFIKTRPKTNSIIKFNITVFFLMRSVTPLDPQIARGTIIDIKQHPYQLSLRLNSHHICGAVIISNKWAVTAAHCVKYIFFSLLDTYRIISHIVSLQSKA